MSAQETAEDSLARTSSQHHIHCKSDSYGSTTPSSYGASVSTVAALISRWRCGVAEGLAVPSTSSVAVSTSSSPLIASMPSIPSDARISFTSSTPSSLPPVSDFPFASPSAAVAAAASALGCPGRCQHDESQMAARTSAFTSSPRLTLRCDSFVRLQSAAWR